MCVRRSRGVVRHHHNRLTVVVGALTEETQHFGPSTGVEVSGWFIGEDDLGTTDQCPGRGHPLLLPA